MSAWGQCCRKDICRNPEATLIQKWKPMHNLDSKIHFPGFVCFKFQFHISRPFSTDRSKCERLRLSRTSRLDPAIPDIHVDIDQRRFVHNRTHAPQQRLGRAFSVVSFVYLSAECPFDEFHGINGRPKLDAKLIDRFFHRRRQVSPPINSLTHRFFDGSQHLLYCNVTVGSRHGVAALLPGDKYRPAQHLTRPRLSRSSTSYEFA